MVKINSKVRHLAEAEEGTEWLMEPKPINNHVLSARMLLNDTNGGIGIMAMNLGRKLCIVKEGGKGRHVLGRGMPKGRTGDCLSSERSFRNRYSRGQG